MSWLECVCDSDYLINSEFPYLIKNKKTDKIIKESIHKSTGYIRCSLNCKSYLKHRIVALQFIPNPENYQEIDHINHDKTDYHILNLKWCSRSENQKNRTVANGKKYVFYDELPTTAEPLTKYSNHELKDVFVDYQNKKLYCFNTEKYRELVPINSRGYVYYYVFDTNNKRVHLCHNKLF